MRNLLKLYIRLILNWYFLYILLSYNRNNETILILLCQLFRFLLLFIKWFIQKNWSKLPLISYWLCVFYLAILIEFKIWFLLGWVSLSWLMACLVYFRFLFAYLYFWGYLLLRFVLYLFRNLNRLRKMCKLWKSIILLEKIALTGCRRYKFFHSWRVYCH